MTSGPSSIETTEIEIVVAEDGQSAVDLLASASSISKVKVKRAMTAGAVWINKGKKTTRLRRAKSPLLSGNKLSMYYDEKVLNTNPDAPTLIADERIYSVWYKPSGLLSSGSKFGDHCAINRWIELNHQPQRPTFMVHRLDRFASGLIVLAHTKQAAADLSAQFKNRTVKKVYQVVCIGLLEQEYLIEEALDGKEAVSVVKVLKTDKDLQQSLVEVEIKTGRKHQIRRHLAHIGYPVIGDRQYGETLTGELKLTSCQISFLHPKTKIRMNYELEEALRPKL
ncbi:MAG: tRNA pseudouridine32 synthase/23S rRNA pseudouridine746 synthase [Candidatus Azotimanducaceae bacterium]|jgi:tRNA pseudouridine32 synthase/23S rRNA pseudouridine746 synthase